MLLHGLNHSVDALLGTLGFLVLCDLVAKFHILFARQYEETGYHQRFSLRALAVVFGSLERLVGIPRETVQVQTIVPVGTTDERQHVWTEILNDVIERDAQVFEQRYLSARLIVPRHHFIKNRKVARLLDVSYGTENEPAGVVVETTADVIVTALGQWLVLVVAATVGELCRCNVNDALTGTTGNLMDETYEVLIGVAETHATAYPTLKERSRTREAEGNHALVLVPDIDHAVQTLVGTRDGVLRKQTVPHFLQFLEGSIDSLHSSKTLDGSMCFLLVDQRHIGIL